MKIGVHRTSLPDVLIVEPESFKDDRGFFMEVYRMDVFAEPCGPGAAQPVRPAEPQPQRPGRDPRRLALPVGPADGQAHARRGGEVFLVAVDIRPGSPTLGQYESIIASDRNKLQLWAPASFARGFCVLSDEADVEYLTTGIYNSNA